MHLEFEKICVATDFSKTSEQAIHYGATLAEQLGAELHLLYVIDDISTFVAYGELKAGSLEKLFRSMKDDSLRRLNDMPPGHWRKNLTVRREVRLGVPYHEICKYAKSEQIDLLVMGTRGRTGLKHFLLGSVAERVVRCGPCPILTVRDPDREFVDSEWTGRE